MREGHYSAVGPLAMKTLGLHSQMARADIKMPKEHDDLPSFTLQRLVDQLGNLIIGSHAG